MSETTTANLELQQWFYLVLIQSAHEKEQPSVIVAIGMTPKRAVFPEPTCGQALPSLLSLRSQPAAWKEE